MPLTIPDTPFGDRVRRRLETEVVGWLTTVNANGTPRPSPIWFLWEGDSILIYSKDGTSRTRNLGRNGACSFNFDGNGTGGDIIVLEGTAVVSEDPPSTEIPAYQGKYRDEIPRIGMDPGTFAMAYPVPIRFTPERLRGH
ncbi:MAG: TIGR03667 family PPOX class F420-dependent oxidoreductase [Acidimicrobiia bacterium]|nr:TIGR03667 family PPOX class F420-dependent oxidoreductase [Acidimicrobiia bacterium]NNF87485.1 TIGR03667 family PPOX class F420-dependent oxidoreductase [Acidimicrobiia bacterium]NNL13427.1 TIGR03667 family PPOX class F420-dependent oxidoreductase [Acidimicrobiia bacterium]NNL48621.1 TIGR03667 family PPOX class F420-dependent oxidoreductase [Acidimicrobiia bacterium]NNL98941.1 TIGR03667 family PPOX class F420-dependent oxidoreductase [Acidimicrobiia bacterium]